MAVERKTTFLNLIDRVIVLEKGGKTRSDEVFRKIINVSSTSGVFGNAATARLKEHA